MQQRFSSTNRWLGALGLAAVLGLTSAQYAHAGAAINDCGDVNLSNQLCFDTELVSLDLTGGPYPIPLGADPGNLIFPEIGTTGLAADGGLASIDGYSFVKSDVTITLSSQRGDPGPSSTGIAIAHRSFEDFLVTANGGFPSPSEGCIDNGVVDPVACDGQLFQVDSFFDVFFDITITDVDSPADVTDPERNFGDGQGGSLGHGATIDGNIIPSLFDVGSAKMQTFHTVIFDKNAPNFGLIPPPQVNPYIGHFNIEIPLGININLTDWSIKTHYF